MLTISHLRSRCHTGGKRLRRRRARRRTQPRSRKPVTGRAWPL